MSYVQLRSKERTRRNEKKGFTLYCTSVMISRRYIMKGSAYYLRPKQSYVCENDVCRQGRRQTTY